MELFVAEVTARTAADLIGLHRNSPALFYHKLRHFIAEKTAEADPEFGAFEVDESYFGGVRKGKRGRGAAGKVLVFGILKRGGKVHALPVADASGPTLLPEVDGACRLSDSVISQNCPSFSLQTTTQQDENRSNDIVQLVANCRNFDVDRSDSGIVFSTTYAWNANYI